MTDTIWYAVTGNGRPITLDTRGSAIDTVMAVYDGVSGDFLRCNDDVRTGAEAPDIDSELTFSSVSGRTYMSRSAPAASAAAARRPRAASSSSPSAPRRTTRGRPPSRSPPRGPTAARNWGATTDAGERVVCGSAPFSRTVWFRYTATGTGTAVFTASGNFDTGPRRLSRHQLRELQR